MLDYLESPAQAKPLARMFWLHGLGADGDDLEPVAEALEIAGIHHVLPHAPVRPVTLNGGLAMRAWYDIAGPDLRWREDAGGMKASVMEIQALIEHFRQNMDVPVILAGFSQGAVISLLTAANGIPHLRCVAALSGYVAQSLTPAAEPDRLHELPVFMAHGIQDEVIPLSLAQQGHLALSALGAQVDWHEYLMPHSICQQEIDDLRVWIKGLLAI